jgi:pilin isopeptide linkage protein
VTYAQDEQTAVLANSDDKFDITNLMTTDSYIKVEVDGTFYTLEELEANGLKVPKGATIYAHLVWDKITGIQEGQKLVYQIPKKMVTNIVEEDRFEFFDSHNTFAGYMALSEDGLFTVEIDSNYFKSWSKKQGTPGSLELDMLSLDFYGALSTEHGETSGGDDAVVTFKGETEGEPQSAVKFTIPFEYKNEHSPVDVKKESKFDAANQVINYTVTVSTPKSNTMTSENVVLTDVFDSTTYLVNDGKNTYGLYGSVKAILYTNTNDGASLTGGTDISDQFNLNRSGGGTLKIGDMAPDSVVVLTYTVKVKDDYFSGTSNPDIVNSALATYNDITTSVGRNSASSAEKCGGMVKIAKSVSNIKADSDGKSYVEYTVTVTAYNSQVSNITVKDDIIKQVNNSSITVDAFTKLDGFSQSSVDYNPTDKSFVWTIAKLDAWKSITLTYKAYLNPEAWDLTSTESNGNAIQQKVTVENKASLYVDDTLYGYATTDKYGNGKELTKTWVNKVGKKNNDGSVNYTLYVNSDPAASDITEIHDTLYTDGVSINYPVTMKVYKSSSNKVLVGTYSLNKGDAGVNADDTHFSVTLAQLDSSLANQAYYYELTYSVTNNEGASLVKNSAGINRSNGVVYGEGTSVAVVTISCNKNVSFVDYVNGYISWTTTMRTDIDAGAVYYDSMDNDKVWKKNWWENCGGVCWYTLEDINGIEVYQGDELIYSQAQGINKYNISVEPYCRSDTGPHDIPYYVWNSTFTSYSLSGTLGQGYCGFKIIFGQNISASNKNPIYIKYNLSVNKDNIYTQSRNTNSSVFRAGGMVTDYPLKFKNNWWFELASGVTAKDEGGDENNDTTMMWFFGTEDVMKGAKYDSTSGIITWKIYINRQGDMMGDATVEDIIPAGLEYVDASLDYDTWSADTADYMGSSFISTNDKNGSFSGNIKENGITAVKQENGTTKLTVELENLKGYTFDNYTQNADGTWTATVDGSDVSAAKKSSWYRNCTVVLTVQTRVSNELLMQGVTQDFTNNVTVYNDTMAYGYRTASKTQTVSMTEADVLNKSMASYTSGTTLKFTLDINKNGEDLIYKTADDEGNTLEIMDVMADKMSLATWKDNYFVVKDSAGNELTAADSADISDNQYYLTPVDSDQGTAYRIVVPDGKALTITYLVTVNAAVGEDFHIYNKAYFNYTGLTDGTDASTYEKDVTIKNAKGGTDASADASFKIYKQDQWGNPVKGVTFALYKVVLDDSGAAVYENDQVKLGDCIDTKTTDATGYVEFTDLDSSAVYCFYETAVPTGYAKSAERTYFYYMAQKNLGIASALGIDYNEKIFTVTNAFSPASLTLPVVKTINGEEQQSTEVFNFTLTNTGTGTAYTDQPCTTAAATTLEANVTGSGTVSFGTLYFKDPGTYTFQLSEKDLTGTQTKEGFTKDDTVYTITAVVTSGDNGLSVTATWTDGENTGTLPTDTLTFDNTLHLDPVTVKLQATKAIGGDKLPSDITEGQFTFEVVENGDIIAIGRTAAGSRKGSDIVFYRTQFDDEGNLIYNADGTIAYGEEGIEYGQDDLGTHVLTIYEVAGLDSNITYSTVKFVARVVVAPKTGDKQLEATVTYSTRYADDLDEAGYPVFTNTYKMPPLTGTRMDFLPYVLVTALALTAGAAIVIRRKRHNKA